MKSRTRTNNGLLLTIILLVSLFALWGCPKKAEVSAVPEAQKEAAPAEVAKPEAKAEAKSEAAAAAEAEAAARAREEAAARERAAAAAGTGLKPIYFDFDRSFVREDARPVMKANAEWLKANPKVKIRIEGNCDERGTIEYNQALGQRRAAAAKKYLTDTGIAARRISLISYGKEKQICKEHTEDCWQKTRRDDLVAATE